MSPIRLGGGARKDPPKSTTTRAKPAILGAIVLALAVIPVPAAAVTEIVAECFGAPGDDSCTATFELAAGSVSWSNTLLGESRLYRIVGLAGEPHVHVHQTTTPGEYRLAWWDADGDLVATWTCGPRLDVSYYFSTGTECSSQVHNSFTTGTQTLVVERVPQPLVSGDICVGTECVLHGRVTFRQDG